MTVTIGRSSRAFSEHVTTVDATVAVRNELSQVMQRSYVAAYRILDNPDQAREACQEAATRALAAADQYDPSRPFYAWFHRILRNHCLDRLRERQRMVAEIAEGAAPATAEAGLVENERMRAVTAAIGRLPDELRDVIELRHFQDASYDEIAAALELPVGTVMSRLYRARSRLRELLVREPAFAGEGRR